MKSLFSKKAKTIIGLDIGTKFVKAVSLNVSDERTSVTSFACEPIVGNAFSERELKDFDAVSKALKKVRATLKDKSKDCAMAVAGSSVISKLVYMDPDQTDFELESQIELEADSLIPYPLNEVYLDFEELRPSDTHIGKVEVLLSAAHKDMVDSRITVVREAPFEPKIVDIESNALGEAFTHYLSKQNQDDEIQCCINIGASLLQICVTQDNQVIYAKEHAFGTNKLNQDISLIQGVDISEVESKIVNDAIPEEWLAQTTIGFVSAMQQHIQRALQMYMATTHKAMPSKIYLSGGVTIIRGICDDLEKELSVSVDVFNPFKNMGMSETVNAEKLLKIAPQLTIAVGLASRRLESWQK